MKVPRLVPVFAFLLLALLTVPSYGDDPVTVLYSFTGGDRDGVGPVATWSGRARPFTA